MSETTMKPIIVLPVDTVSKEDIKLLNENGLCVIEAKNPALVRLMDPIPSQIGRTKIEEAAIALSRRLLSSNADFDNFGGIKKSAIHTAFVECIVKGTPLQSGPTKEEREEAFFNQVKYDELRRLARAEAKEERDAAKKKAKADTDKKGKP